MEIMKRWLKYLGVKVGIKQDWFHFWNFWIIQIYFWPITSCHVASLISIFFKMAWWPIREWTLSLPSYSTSANSPFFLYFSLLSPSLIGHEFLLLFRRFTIARDVHAPQVDGAQPSTTKLLKPQPENSSGAAPVSRWNLCILSLFLANFGVVRPPIMVRSSVLERALHPLQNRAPFD